MVWQCEQNAADYMRVIQTSSFLYIPLQFQAINVLLGWKKFDLCQRKKSIVKSARDLLRKAKFCINLLFFAI